MGDQGRLSASPRGGRSELGAATPLLRIAERGLTASYAPVDPRAAARPTRCTVSLRRTPPPLARALPKPSAPWRRRRSDTPTRPTRGGDRRRRAEHRSAPRTPSGRRDVGSARGRARGDGRRRTKPRGASDAVGAGGAAVGGGAAELRQQRTSTRCRDRRARVRAAPAERDAERGPSAAWRVAEPRPRAARGRCAKRRAWQPRPTRCATKGRLAALLRPSARWRFGAGRVRGEPVPPVRARWRPMSCARCSSPKLRGAPAPQDA